jgi:hypothetical protein
VRGARQRDPIMPARTGNAAAATGFGEQQTDTETREQPEADEAAPLREEHHREAEREDAARHQHGLARRLQRTVQ